MRFQRSYDMIPSMTGNPAIPSATGPVEERKENNDWNRTGTDWKRNPHAHGTTPEDRGMRHAVVVSGRRRSGVGACGAVFADGMDGSVAVLAPDGWTLDTLPATYRGRGISYRLLGSGELVAHPSMERGGIATYGMDGYAVCIARSALGGGVTGTVSGAITGGVPGASLGAVGGIIGGMVWGPFDCWGKTS